MKDKTIGVIGTGKIGKITAKILLAMECKLLCFDPFRDAELEAHPAVKYVGRVSEIFPQVDAITLHAPATKENYHLISSDSISRMKQGVVVVNTSRGSLIDSKALIAGLKSGKLGGVALDVYEGEQSYFFEDWQNRIIPDDILVRLMTFPNVIITSHQGFFTKEALQAISEKVKSDIRNFLKS